MTARKYERFAIHRPEFLGDEHWESIELELDRLSRSLDAEDDGQALSDLKCLVEAVARVTLEIAGEPAQPSDPLDKTVGRAHRLLAGQPGQALVVGGEFGRIASHSSKIARTIGIIRNQYGGGHGRSRRPHLRDEMVDLALDGALMWCRWSVRRLGLFSEGRPTSLVRDLVEQPATFYSGDLRRRLEAANLSSLELHHQQELGVAVGQRVMRETFVVRWDGLDPCLKSDGLVTWPGGYRIGLLRGLWFNPDGLPTITPQSIRDGLSVIDPVPDAAETLNELVKRVVVSTEPSLPDADRIELQKTVGWLSRRIPLRPEGERAALHRLEQHLNGVPF